MSERGALSIAMVGTRGVPARYGGFETAVEEVGRRLADRGHDVVVYCRAADGSDLAKDAPYLGMRRVSLPAMRKRSLETLSHTALSVGHLLGHRVDAAFVFNAANAPLLPVLRAARIPVATHVDGLEWKRAKWGGGGRRYYRGAESAAVRWSDALIADAPGIAAYYTDEFGAETRQIAYGAPIIEQIGSDKLAEVGVRSGAFHLVVARFEPENHVDVIVDGYVASGATLPLVVVGAAPYAQEYTDRIRSVAAGDPRVHLVGSVWEPELLDQLYAHALTYVHGHSVGGTNPSLLRAIGAGTATIAFDVAFNRDVLGDLGRYFTDPADVAREIADIERTPALALEVGTQLRERARSYDWDEVAGGYEALARDLVARNVPGRQRGRRRRTSTPPAAEPTRSLVP
ncbi:DUF1972 domain-containing protein [Cellulomonas sp. URHE0023]|uniref:DUF1972 domain-containing protein n=1 Tax=Cellulomonas sp. URHE0023 TaxID=1380354 RepID=UPI000553E0DD|nr:DUF1972 domain-containing protein [Cellulomonas sp. URHE0023]